MHPFRRVALNLTRRQLFAAAGGGVANSLGVGALVHLLTDESAGAAPAGHGGRGALASLHFVPRAKRVIYLHMMGGPSQLDLFDYKPVLRERAGQDLRKMPEVYQNQRITGMTSGQSSLPLVPSKYAFARHDNDMDGLWVSELLPYTAGLAKKLCVVHSMYTDAINHEPGVTFMQTGSQIPGRPSMGAWLSYGLGRTNEELPAFVVMLNRGFGNPQALSDRLWGAGFLASEHQGVRFRSGSEPVLFLDDPQGVTRRDRRRLLDAVAELNELEYERSLDPEVRTRILQGEMAFRMQMSVPELVDFSSEDESTLALYGPDVRKPGSFAANCLLARRLAERGVRFIQLYINGWDAHGNLPREHPVQCQLTDQASAALVLDLERRGLLDDTLVVWGGEFGRTAYCQGKYDEGSYGRDHHPRCFTMWMAGGGIRPGITHGRTDEFGYNVVEDPVSVHDLHATILRLLGIDHERLTFRHQGRRFRLTDVAGNVVQRLLA
ncbi:MAG: DUF1501 domain-containing protein [Planctomycetota bacterium]